MGANFGDVDNDGFLDMYLGMGAPSFATIMPHVLLRNNDGRYSVDITASSGTGELHKGHGIAFADLAGEMGTKTSLPKLAAPYLRISTPCGCSGIRAMTMTGSMCA